MKNLDLNSLSCLFQRDLKHREKNLKLQTSLSGLLQCLFLINYTSISSGICLASAFRRMCFSKAFFSHTFQTPSITHFRKWCKRLLENYGIWRGWETINTVCFGRKMISRNGDVNHSLRCETFSGKLYNTKLQIAILPSFPVYSSAQPYPYQWSLRTVFKFHNSVRLRDI